LTCQANVEWWEQADPLWVLPAYVSDFSWDLAKNWELIKNSGVANPTTMNSIMTYFPMLSKPQDLSDRESEVETSNEVLPSLQWIVLKVQLLDEVEHILDKGVWVVMPAIHWGWEIFVAVSTPVPFSQ